MQHPFTVQALIKDGLFIRDGKSRDSANILNTTNVFVEKY